MQGVPIQSSKAIRYRRDIDGLRAVAVLLVLFNHLTIRQFSGGYVGVDVFFVISGYLISSVILTEMSVGQFSIAAFYLHRIRRIVPALIIMLVGSIGLAYGYLMPSEIEEFGRSVIAALCSFSNILFWHQASYFDAPSSLKPLLNTWSLGVEEQFYLVFPLFLLAIRRWLPKRLRVAIWSFTVLTFALSCVTVLWAPSAAFYLAPLRAWELLIGTILSQRYVPPINTAVSRDFCALVGLALILVPASLYNSTTQFPGMAALPVCVGTALVISAGEMGSSLVGRLLSVRPFVFVGLISYSLYLWHWPIIVFLEENSLFSYRSPKIVKLEVLGASLLVACLSWWLVETPFRSGQFGRRRRTLLFATGIPTTLIAATGIYMVASKGAHSRFPPEAAAVDRYTDFDFSSAFRTNVCFIDPLTAGGSFSDFKKQICMADDPTRRNYLLVGDSHAAHLYYGLRKVFPGINIMQATAAACKPFLPQTKSEQGYCTEMQRYIYTDYLTSHHVDKVLIGGRWTAADIPRLHPLILWLQSKKIDVALFGPGIEFDTSFPRLLAVSIRDHNPAIIDQHENIDSINTDSRLSEAARYYWNVQYISAYEDLCGDGQEKRYAKIQRCPPYAGSAPLIFDEHHFTPEASVLYARRIRTLGQLP